MKQYCCKAAACRTHTCHDPPLLQEQRPQMGTEQHSHAPILTASEAAVR
jgi:hypothetical protein